MGNDDDYQDLHFAEDGEYTSALIKKSVDNAAKQHPIEYIEPIIVEMHDYDRGFRDARMRFNPTLDAALSHILLSDDKNTAIYQVAFALNLNGICQGKSMEEIATKIGVTRACISKGAKQFGESLDLPPSNYMKSTLACANYAQERIERVKRGFNKPREI